MTVTSLAAYELLLGAVACERAVEVVMSERHARALFARGAFERGRGHYPAMVVLHASFLVACALEPALLRRPFVPALAAAMLAVVLASQALRWWSVATLGVHWSTRLVVLPGASRVARGPYRFFPHPNYVAVVTELAALPLVHSAWITAAAFSVANAALLSVRVRAEDAALRAMRSA